MEWPDIASYAYAYEKIDLRESGFLPSVYNQGKLGSCTANAIAAAFSYVHSKDCDKKKDLNSLSPNDSCQVFEPSRLFIYYNERLMENTVMVDSGASIRDGIKSISKVGVCPESDYPYIIDRFRDHPGKKAYADASKHKSIEYRCINIDLGEVRKAISVDLPIVFGFSVYKSFEKIGSDGVMPLPEENEKLLGGHAVLIVGYDNEKEHLIVLNSWGSSWGDNGYFYMPYDFFTPLTCADAWIVSRIEETI
jgi:C1A family cysteine protease